MRNMDELIKVIIDLKRDIKRYSEMAEEKKNQVKIFGEDIEENLIKVEKTSEALIKIKEVISLSKEDEDKLDELINLDSMFDISEKFEKFKLDKDKKDNE